MCAGLLVLLWCNATLGKEDRGKEGRGKEDRGKEGRGKEGRGKEDRGKEGRDAPYGVLWKLKTTSAWPPALMGSRVILKQGDTLTAHALDSGKVFWSIKVPNPSYGKGALAAGRTFLYLLSQAGVQLIEPTQGRLLRIIPLPRPRTVLYKSDSIYVSSEKGIQRFDHLGQQLLQSAPEVKGELQGADGHFVAVYQRVADQDPGDSPKRLAVVDLRNGKQVYEFKLLAQGEHQLAQISAGKISFIDYSQLQSKGTNAKKLYYTEADYQISKKLRDISLSNYYTEPRAETFWITTSDAGMLFIGNHGSAGVTSSLLAYNPRGQKALWSQTGNPLAMGLLLHHGRLWTGTTGKDHRSHLMVYDPETGKTLFQYPLDAPGMGNPIALNQRVLLRTRDSLYCFAPKVEIEQARNTPPPDVSSPAAIPSTPPLTVKPGWQLMRDRVAGYLLQTPSTWSVDRANIRKLGGVRFVIPFSRKGPPTNRTTVRLPLATIQIMTWEAAGRNAKEVWRSVFAQRKKLSRNVRVSRVHSIKDVGQSGAEGLLAVYNFTSPEGYPAQLRSLCLVHHGVAFEVRAWVGPHQQKLLWKEIRDILVTFQPQQF